MALLLPPPDSLALPLALRADYLDAVLCAFTFLDSYSRPTREKKNTSIFCL
jgi:hypothetical protein